MYHPLQQGGTRTPYRMDCLFSSQNIQGSRQVEDQQRLSANDEYTNNQLLRETLDDPYRGRKTKTMGMVRGPPDYNVNFWRSLSKRIDEWIKY